MVTAELGGGGGDGLRNPVVRCAPSLCMSTADWTSQVVLYKCHWRACNAKNSDDIVVAIVDDDSHHHCHMG